MLKGTAIILGDKPYVLVGGEFESPDRSSRVVLIFQNADRRVEGAVPWVSFSQIYNGPLLDGSSVFVGDFVAPVLRQLVPRLASVPE